MRYACRRMLLGAGILFSVLSFQNFAFSEPQKDSLIFVKRADGTDSTLAQKVVVVSSKGTLSKTPTGQGEPIEPWGIFFRIKNEDGTTNEVNSKLRVGDSTGTPVGWIAAKDVREWNTRFILDPIEPQGERAFEIKLNGGGSAKQNATPEGKRRYALITNPPKVDVGDDNEYPVIVYAGNVQGVGEGGVIARQRNELADVKLEIVFVVESTDFMLNKFSGDSRPLFDYLKDTIRETLDLLSMQKSLAGAVRVGFVEYQDNVPLARFTAKKSCDLTDNIDAFLGKLSELEATLLEDDFPEDVIAGMNMAVSEMSWSENSVKHVILLGAASCQLCDRGNNPNQTGGVNNLLTVRNGPKGYNSTGLSISQLIGRARPQGGGDSRARTSKTFHSLFLGKELPSIPESFIKASESLISMSNDELGPLLEGLAKEYGQEKTSDFVHLAVMYQLLMHQRQLGMSQYQQIASNNGEADGIFISVEPSSGAVSAAAKNLSEKIQVSFKALEAVREGEGLSDTKLNEISQPLFTLVGAAAEKFKDSPVLEGVATVRDVRGREIAFKKVLVSEVELQRLKSTFDALYTKFKGRSSKSDRQDVGSILQELKEILVQASTGQDLSADAKLKDLISDLPLRTAALDTSASDLAVMTTEAFTEWLDRVQAAVFRIEDLLNNRQDWLVLSEKAVNEKFTFLRLSELP